MLSQTFLHIHVGIHSTHSYTHLRARTHTHTSTLTFTDINTDFHQLTDLYTEREKERKQVYWMCILPHQVDWQWTGFMTNSFGQTQEHPGSKSPTLMAHTGRWFSVRTWRSLGQLLLIRGMGRWLLSTNVLWSLLEQIGTCVWRIVACVISLSQSTD